MSPRIVLKSVFRPTTRAKGYTALARGCALAALACVALGSIASGASAESVDVAKRCEALTIQAFPPASPATQL
jgi:hypothetical protein